MWNLAELKHRWKAAAGDVQRLGTLPEYRYLADELLSSGAPLQALEVAEEGCAIWADDLELACIKGRALARSGSSSAAAMQLTSVVDRLRQETTLDRRLLEEAIGVLARTEKDQAFSVQELAQRQYYLQRSLSLYREAYAQTGGYWTGINVATLATLLGQDASGRQVALEVMELCQTRLDASEDSDDYWLYATLGEAALNLQDWTQAELYYRKASSLAGRRFGDIRSMQRHVEWLLEHFQQDPSWTQKWLPLPAVAVFTGHIIDVPNRTSRRFPPEMESAVRDAICKWVELNDVGLGYCSAACGSDILFLEVLQQMGAETHIILPFAEDAFLKTSVEIGVEGRWGDRFQQVIERASSVIRTAREQTLESAETYRHANQVIAGLAKIKARELGTDLLGLAVWNGDMGQAGGTGDATMTWSGLGIPMTRVVLESPSESAFELATEPVDVMLNLEPVGGPKVPHEFEPQQTLSQLMYLLFADVVGYSQLDDLEIKQFATDCFSEIAEVLTEFADAIVVRQTAGDGFYLAFSSLAAAGNCSLAISKYFAETDWLARGFRSILKLRAALHAGPIILARDAITGAMIGVGSHVNRAARLEPKTPPSQVYASETFAALAALEVGLDFDCRYVKQLEWAKRYGTFPTYLVFNQ